MITSVLLPLKSVIQAILKDKKIRMIIINNTDNYYGLQKEANK